MDFPPVKNAHGLEETGTSDEFIQKLRAALQRDGDFPASARTVAELRALVTDPKTTATQVTELILKEPSLGTRVLHLVNSSFYRRAKPIMTVSQAVIQIGMRPLAELCAGLILLQKFIPNARRGGPFSSCLQKTILTSLLASSFSSNLGSHADAHKGDETGYLAGSFLELGTLLLAYYFPQLYETAVKRSESKKQEVSKSIEEIVGLSPVDLSLEVISALNLPEYYKQTLISTKAIEHGQVTSSSTPLSASEKLGQALYASQKISGVLVHSRQKSELDQTLGQLKGRLKFDQSIFANVLAEVSTSFKNHCSSMELSCQPLPDFVATYGQTAGTDPGHDGQNDEGVVFGAFVDEIREAVENREPTASIITRVMETFAWHLSFDRVLLLLVGPGKKKLQGRMMLGSVENFDPKTFERSLTEGVSEYSPDFMAFKEGRPVFTGDPLLPNGWPLVAIPVGFGSRLIGVLYADRSSGKDSEISAREQAAIGVLAELLDRSVSLQSR